ncbi:M14 family zinc carboxypeptidase [Streptomyces sp. NPDC051940]|uniref:M14 family zinc carboxypeptidase n=1 Tax=Streptomyces sp. NPDC051940 TaxID=3155675 RepID=UPI0034148FC8
MLTNSQGYPTVDDLVRGAREVVRRHPEVCGLREVGRSRAGDPLWLVSVGDPGPGDRNILVVAGPHANEPAGGATALHLAAVLSREPRLRSGLTWHFLLCLDPDGARINEGWVREPGDPADYFRGMYRPVTDGQPEWLPPAGRAPLPETAALVRLLNEYRPLAQFSLHANDVGGTWIQTTEPLPAVAAMFAKTATELDIPLEIAPFDAFHMPSPAPGVFVMPEPDASASGVPRNDLSARSTWFHPVPGGTVTVLIEATQWAVPEIADATPVADPPAELTRLVAGFRRRTARLAELVELAAPWLDSDHVRRGPLAASARWVAQGCAEIADEWAGGLAAASRAALARTAGNAAALRLTAHRLSLRAAGMLARALPPGRDTDGVRRAVLGQFDAWYTEFEAETKPRWVPVRDQVELQSRTILAVAADLDGVRG